MFPKIGVPQNGWFIMEKPSENGWFGGFSPYFWKHPYSSFSSHDTTSHPPTAEESRHVEVSPVMLPYLQVACPLRHAKTLRCDAHVGFHGWNRSVASNRCDSSIGTKNMLKWIDLLYIYKMYQSNISIIRKYWNFENIIITIIFHI